jgi:hypothetical protein
MAKRLRATSIRARLRYHLPVEASCEADDLRLDHRDIPAMSGGERWVEAKRVTSCLVALAEHDCLIMRRGTPLSGRAWLFERLRHLGASDCPGER